MDTARALRTRFEQICHSELHRLRRKTSALSAEQRAELVAISLAVAHAISAPVEDVLQREDGNQLDEIVARLFGI
ncbi:MAG: hypothetical protein WBC51_20370 [Vicinamibacterales bacterium]